MDEIRVITVSRQMASLGREVAKAAAEKLGFELVHREVINSAALRAGSPEAALASIDELGLLGAEPTLREYRAYRNAVEEVIRELAEQGRVVIVGRAGQAILHDRMDVLHVRVIAPPEIRLKRLIEIHGITRNEAYAQIDASDHYRQRYMRRFYKVRWDDPSLYDLIINTGRLEVHQAAELIVQAAALGKVKAARVSPAALE